MKRKSFARVFSPGNKFQSILAFLDYIRKEKIKYSYTHVDGPLFLIKNVRRQVIFNLKLNKSGLVAAANLINSAM